MQQNLEMGEEREDADEAIFNLLFEWYGCAPKLSRINALRDEQLRNLWTTLWMANGALTVPLDNRLRDAYAKHFDTFAFATEESAPLPAPPVGNDEMRLLWHVGLAVLCDQVSRNVFR